MALLVSLVTLLVLPLTPEFPYLIDARADSLGRDPLAGEALGELVVLGKRPLGVACLRILGRDLRGSM